MRPSRMLGGNEEYAAEVRWKGPRSRGPFAYRWAWITMRA